jgi:outer membrane protein assembly factor BamE (lipoprotein component of BamABCDE complex)
LTPGPPSRIIRAKVRAPAPKYPVEKPMSREDRPHRKGKPFPVAVVAIFGTFGLVVLLAVGLGAYYFVGKKGDGTSAKVYTRQEFSAKVIGKTSDEVIAAVGKPNSTQQFGRDPNWYYDYRTYDPITGKKDPMIQVVFVNGVVERVNY